MTKRFVLGNLIFYLEENRVLILNLITFRREIFSTKILSLLFEIEYKINNKISLSNEENLILKELYDTKQILSNEVVSKLDHTLELESELFVNNINKFAVKICSINLTHECNFGCTYCYQNKYKMQTKYKQFMTIKDIDLINKYLAQDYFIYDELDEFTFSGGESLLPQNINTINYALKNIKSKKFNLFTNGVNLYDYRKHIDYSNINEFQISLDGMPEIIKRVNKNEDLASFDKIIKGIKYVESLNKTISIIVIWTRELEQCIDEFIDILKKNDIKVKPNMNIRFSLAKDYYSTKTIDDNFYDIDYLCSIVKKINLKLSKIGSFIEVYEEGSTLSSLIYRPANQRKLNKYKHCDLAKTIPMTFEPNGEVLWCLCLGSENGCIGNYKDNVYFNKDKVLKLGNRTIYKIEKCKNCELRYLCAAGCPLPLLGNDNNIHQPVCGLYEIDEFWNRLEELI